MDPEIEISLNKSFLNIKKEEKYKIVDLESNIPLNDVLSFFFHNKTSVVEKDGNLKLQSLEKSRFLESVVCYTCGESGHVTRDCSNVEERRCLYCDTMHKNESCKFLLCFNCGNLGHTEYNCREKTKQPLKCKKCSANHDVRECPSKWRRYTIKQSKNRNTVLSCPLCFSNDHMMDDCEFNESEISLFTVKYRNLIKKNPKTSKK
ncbi:hypothetical protein NUSPORA_01722 [Nucleospora cyclopteri]